MEKQQIIEFNEDTFNFAHFPFIPRWMTSVTLSLKGFRRFWKKFPLSNLRSKHVLFNSDNGIHSESQRDVLICVAIFHLVAAEAKVKIGNHTVDATENILLMR